MSDIPADVFTEPAEIAPTRSPILGPLRRVAGVWEGDKGLDVAPKAEGPERAAFVERSSCSRSIRNPTGRSSSMGFATTPASSSRARRSPSTTRWATGSGSRPPGSCCRAWPYRGARSPWPAATPARRLQPQAFRAPGYDRQRDLLDDVPRERLPHGFIRHRSDVPPGRLVELFRGHGVNSRRPSRTVPSSRQEHFDEGGRAAT